MDTITKRDEIKQDAILQMLDRGINDVQEGRVYSLDEAFHKVSEIRQMRKHEREKRH